MMLAVTGERSRIVEELRSLLPDGEGVVRIDEEIPECERYLLCAGLLRPKRWLDQDPKEIAEGLGVNLMRPVELCEEILAANDNSRICVVGSESGYSGSYDTAYAVAKAGLHHYVRTRKLGPSQQLVCVAPSIVDDAGMTLRRDDRANLAYRRASHPKRRFLTSLEVAKLIHFLLYIDLGYITGTVIRMHGGCGASEC